LEDLIAAKATHENELLKKFCDLLNEKKSKIRDQQRLLASAKVDPVKIRAVQAARKTSKPREAGASRPGKRKAKNGQEETTEEEDKPDSGFKKVDVDVDKVPYGSDQEVAMTPEEDETAEETTDEDNEELAPQAMAPARSTRQSAGDKGKAAARITAETTKFSRGSTAPTTGGQKKEKQEEEAKTPPRRQLPFSKKQAARRE
jgi:hypothetical protein